MSKPKKGDVVSEAFSCAGFTTYETQVIARVRGEKLWILGNENHFDLQGNYSDNGFAGASKRLIFDGGKRAKA